jgi:hypothetical protein
MGDVFPDFDSMTPEEQMAWLESLAKRQGVKDEELTTKADLDIPIPENAQVDEPGYVPFEGSASARKMKEMQEAAQAQAESEAPAVEPSEEPVWAEAELSEPVEEIDLLGESIWAESEAAEPVEEIDLSAEVGDTADPMRWLDSLAAQPEGELEDLSDLFAESEAVAFEQEEQEAFEPEAQEQPEYEEEAAPQAQAADDLLGGMDPMLWLESLAKRQGAKADELLTAADLDVEEMPEGTVVEEPGYVPFEGSASARKMKEAAAAPPEPGVEPEVSGEPEGIGEPAEAEEFAEQELPSASEEEDVLSGADPMRWLESLAKRRGAKPEELLTQADLEIPELPEDTVIDEPGYVEYSPFSILPPDQDIEVPEIQESAEGTADFEAADEALSWLEDLAAEPDEDLSEILAFGDEMFEPVAEEVEAEAPAAAEQVAPDDPLAGMSDEQIAYAQAHGQLTGKQELEWLKRQARKLAQVRESQEAEMMAAQEEVEEEEIVPVELPPWLAQMREEAEQIGEGVAPSVEEPELPAEAVDLSGWLEEAPAAEAELDLAELTLDTAELSEADVDSLWGEAPEAEFELEEPALPDDSELAKFLAEGIVPEGADPLAEALDAEYERKLAGDESEPEWYTDAVAKVAADDSVGLEAEIEQAPTMPEEAVVEASEVDMPDWLKETEEEIKSAIAGDEGMPDWLRETGETAPAARKEQAPEWFAEQEAEPAAVEEENLPDWLRELDKAPEMEEVAPVFEAVEPVPEPKPEPKPEPEPEPVKAAPAVVEPEVRKPAKVPPVVQGELLERITQRLKEDPNDHATRLAFARALRDNQQLTPSLDQYETLIDTAQLLQDVSDDLGRLSEEHTGLARVRRLLGDAYMRQGMLQEALDAYRNALEQL